MTRVATYPPSTQMRVERSKVVGQRGRLGEEWADRGGGGDWRGRGTIEYIHCKGKPLRGESLHTSVMHASSLDAIEYIVSSASCEGHRNDEGRMIALCKSNIYYEECGKRKALDENATITRGQI